MYACSVVAPSCISICAPQPKTNVILLILVTVGVTCQFKHGLFALK